MADNYYITINSEKICVSEEVYNVYRQMRRHERTLAEKDSRNFVLKYEDFADGEITGEEQIYDFLQPSVEELALTNIIYRKLHRAIAQRVHVEIAIQKGLNKSRVNNLKILVTHDLFSFRNDVSDELSIGLKAALLPASALILRHVYLANHFS